MVRFREVSRIGGVYLVGFLFVGISVVALYFIDLYPDELTMKSEVHLHAVDLVLVRECKFSDRTFAHLTQQKTRSLEERFANFRQSEIAAELAHQVTTLPRPVADTDACTAVAIRLDLPSQN